MIDVFVCMMGTKEGSKAGKKVEGRKEGRKDNKRKESEEKRGKMTIRKIKKEYFD